MRPVFFTACLLYSVYTAAQTKDSSYSAISVYLTFDDGPMKASRHLADAIKRDSVPVTVFLVGRQVIKNRENNTLLHWYRSNPFVEIANHSYSHANGKYKQYYQSPATVVDDIRVNDTILGIIHKIARLPGRNAWRLPGLHRNDLEDAVPAADSLSANGYYLFGWDIEWCYDSTGKTNHTASQMMAQLRYSVNHGRSFIKDHIVILCHDPMLLNEQTRKEFALFIQYVKADPAFTFRFISSYPVTPLLVTY